MSINTQISQSELSRRLNINAPKLNKAIKQGLVVPDAIIFGRTRLFNVDRIEAIRSALLPQPTMEAAAV